VARRPHGGRPLSRRWLAALVLILAAAWAGAADRSGDATDVLNALLSRLLQLDEVTPPELQKLVGEAGGIPFPSEVPVDFLTHEQLDAYLREVVDSEYPPEEAETDARTLLAFDLIAPGVDLRRQRLDLLQQNIAGFYDERPERRRLYVVSDEARLTPINQLILAHEMRHALQDQHADVHAVIPDSVGDFDDRRLAYLAVLEGDATLVMEHFLRHRLEQGGRPAPEMADFSFPVGDMPGTAPVLRDQMVLPYVLGTPFARELLRRGGWEAVKEVWSRPPESSEQVIHPDKYWAHEHPSNPVVPYSPRRGARMLREGVLGEGYVRTLLGEGSESAAAGWAGDHYRVWDVKGRTLLVWRTAWEDGDEAQEFWTALQRRHARTHQSAGTRRQAVVFRKGSWTVALWRRGAEAWLVSSDERGLLKDAVDELSAIEGGRS
jgi:hypothetical protein